jgi:uncharacterized lipoprotein YajG
MKILHFLAAAIVLAACQSPVEPSVHTKLAEPSGLESVTLLAKGME